MASTWQLVENVVDQSDIILEVLDARLPDETRNSQLEELVKKRKKRILYVLNKCDLADRESLERTTKVLVPSVFVSSRDRLGTTMLRNRILSMAKKDKVMVGVCGYPNTGKSSLINALSGRSKTRTSPISGFTKAVQLAGAGRITLIDTPGVIPYDETDEVFLAMIGAKDYSKLKSPDFAAEKIIGKLGGRIEKFYGVSPGDIDEVLDAIALKRGKLLKGGIPDAVAAAKIVVRDWQEGRIK